MDKKDKIQVSIIASCSLLLLGHLFFAKGKKEGVVEIKGPKNGMVAPQKTATNVRKDDEILYFKLDRETQGMDIARDPFSIKQKIEFSGPRLMGILWDEEVPVVIINGQILKVGDKILGYRLKAIEKDRAILNNGSTDLILRVWK